MDTAGQERYEAITRMFYQFACGAFLVFDISQRDTFERCDHWYQEIQVNAGDTCRILLIGNKCDLDKER